MEPDVLELETYRPSPVNMPLAIIGLVAAIGAIVYLLVFSERSGEQIKNGLTVAVISLGISFFMFRSMFTETIRLEGRKLTVTELRGSRSSAKQYQVAGAAKATVERVRRTVSIGDNHRTTVLCMPLAGGDVVYLCWSTGRITIDDIAVKVNEYLDRTRPS